MEIPMDNLQELSNLLGKLGLPQPVPKDAPAGLDVTQTVLIKIEDPSPRRIRADMKLLPGRLSDQDILDAFAATQGWDKISEKPNGKKTRLDIKYPAAQGGTLIAFQLRTSLNDTFIHYPDDEYTFALMKSAQNTGEHLFETRWVAAGTAPPDFKTVRMIASDSGRFCADFILGVNVVDGQGAGKCPIFIDPKIENNG
jgi:hypothetical protein